jgi:integrase
VQVEAIRRVLSEERVGTRDAWVIDRDRLLVSMMGYEACRQQDLYGACWWQLIDDNGEVRKRFVIASGKTRAAEREVKLWRQVREEIAAYYERCGQPDLDELIFPGIRGAVMTRQNWQRDVWRPAFRNARRLAGFEDLRHFGPHRLRACAATMLGYALTPQHVALDFLGHEQWTTTAKFYLVAFEDTEELEGVPVEEQIELALSDLAASLRQNGRADVRRRKAT